MVAEPWFPSAELIIALLKNQRWAYAEALLKRYMLRIDYELELLIGRPVE